MSWLYQTVQHQPVYINMPISTCLYQIVKSTCLNHLLCHSFDITSSASLLLPTCVWRGRDGTWWPRQILVSPATERSARFCVCACQECSLAWQARHLVALGIHLCRQCPRVLVCGRNASLHARRNIMSTSTCLYHIFSFNMAISKRLYQHVQLNMSKRNCLYQPV